MRIINNSLAAHGQPFSSVALSFLQTAWTETIAATIIAQIGSNYSTSTVYILFGCTSSTSGGSTSIAAGALFYNGEIFLTNGATFTTPAGGNIVVTNLLLTFDDPTPGTTFADGTTAQIRQIRMATFASGASGSGTLSGTSASDYANLVNADQPFISTGITLGSIATNYGLPYYDLGYKIKGNIVYLCGVLNVTIPSAGSYVLFTLPASASPSITGSDVILNPFKTVTGIGGFGIILVVLPTGEVHFTTSGASSGIISFEGIFYRLT